VLAVQIILAAVACFGLWRWCRTQPRVVVAGFLLRAIIGQALFWISFLRLPFARSLQLGNGFWFFALDGPHYLNHASKLVARGPEAILFLDDRYPSRFFVQTLATFVAAFGEVASVAILLNCAAYLATCAIVTRLGRNDIVLAAIAFSPASILFSLQPLKDTLFLLLMAVLIHAFRCWEEWWRRGGGLAQLLGWGVMLFAATYALAAIRWYFAVIAWGAAAIFCAMTILASRRRGWAIVAHIVLLLALAQSARLGALDMPPSFARLMNPTTAIRWRPATATSHITEVRSGFETTPGATTIAPGTALETSPPSEPGPTQAPVAVPESKPAPVPEPEPTAAPITPASSVEQSLGSRLTTGFAAMFLPRSVAESLGVIRVGGGRGLWLFAEIDTIVLDLVLLYTIVCCVRSLHSGRAQISATFLWCLLLLLMTAGPMVYTVNNFGTLFRLRLMVYFLVAVLPLTLRTQRTDAVQ
jgi:hypothetical protein